MKQPVAAVIGAIDGVAAFVQTLCQISGSFAVVFDDKDLHGYR